jgi:ABC-2 type transport system ATP-binding protein
MIKAENLTKKFEEFTALRSVNCSIPDGGIYGIAGSNGAGKSTLLRLITGIYKADEGKVLIDNRPVYDNPEVKNLISYIPDELYFLPNSDMGRMAKLYSSVYKSFDAVRYKELTSAFKLDSKKPLNTFSKGMKRQAAVILALSHEHKYLILDEVFDGLDPVMRNYVKDLISDDILEKNATAIITSHSLRELENTCDNLALLHQGKLIFESEIQSLKTNLFKVQVSLPIEYDKSFFNGIEILNFTKHGSVSNLIVRGDRTRTMEIINKLDPNLLEILPLSLEEIFIFEMKGLGYSFDDLVSKNGGNTDNE